MGYYVERPGAKLYHGSIIVDLMFQKKSPYYFHRLHILVCGIV